MRLAYEVHIGINRFDPTESREEAMQQIETAGHGMLLSLFEEEVFEPFPITKMRWRSSAGWVLKDGQWYAIEMHGGGDGSWPVKREEVG